MAEAEIDLTHLGSFLRARRDAVTPEQVGLPRGKKARRTPGLRREEVATLAGVSLTWYTWLEQGRSIHASDDVLTAIGRALKLDDTGIAHLLTLNQPPGDPVVSPQEAPVSLVRLIESLNPTPAFVLGPRYEYLAFNEAYTRLYPRLTTADDDDRNLMWLLFTDPAARSLIVDWDIHARQVVAEFRAATAGLRHDPALADLIGRLKTTSEEFALWWPEHDVSGFESRLRRFRHPAAGELTFEYQQLAPVEWPSLTVHIFLPVPGDDSTERLAERRYLV